jgi:hypothetical protein
MSLGVHESPAAGGSLVACAVRNSQKLASLVIALHGCATVAAAIAREGRAPEARPPVCFGGPPQVLLANQSDPQDLVVAGGKLYWSGAGLQRMDLRTSQVSPVGDVFHGPIVEIGPIDAREVFARTGQDDIVAFDLRTGALRTIVAGHLATPLDFPRVADFRALDGRYLYVTREAGSGLGSARTGGGFARISRDGQGGPELLGAQPRSSGSFAIDGGFVYYVQAREDGTLALARRALIPNAPVQVLAPLAPSQRRWRHAPRMTVSGGRVYYPYDWAIWSVPVTGGAPPVRHVELGFDGAVALLVDQGCLYWATERNIKRLAVDARAPAAPEMVADERDYQLPSDQRLGRVLATDGQFLYWPDPGADRLMRAGRCPAASPLTGPRGGGGQRTGGP